MKKSTTTPNHPLTPHGDLYINFNPFDGRSNILADLPEGSAVRRLHTWPGTSPSRTTADA